MLERTFSADFDYPSGARKTLHLLLDTIQLQWLCTASEFSRNTHLQGCVLEGDFWAARFAGLRGGAGYNTATRLLPPVDFLAAAPEHTDDHVANVHLVQLKLVTRWQFECPQG